MKISNGVKGKFCKDCGMPATYHIQTWLDELAGHLLSFRVLHFVSKHLEMYLDALLEKFLVLFRLASLREDFTRADIQLRSSCFIEEVRKQGIKIKALYGPFGYTNHFQMRIGKKVFRFEGLPEAKFLSKYEDHIVDNKKIARRYLKKGNFPVAKGKAFWFWQKKKAYYYGRNQLGFPLVVKPRSGSVSRHVTTNIKSAEQLKYAIDKAIIYSPAFIIEKFIPNTSVYRATVIDFDFVAVVKQVPANVVGDGKHTICWLIDEKNNSPQRGEPQQKEFTLYKLVEDEVTEKLLQGKGYDFSTVPAEGEIVYLQKDSFLKLGGDLCEVTAKVHPDNFQLFREAAKFFDIRVVGIDFLAQDISLSWKNQPCAILELNSLPCIEMHHFPWSGEPQDVARALVKMVLKHYL